MPGRSLDLHSIGPPIRDAINAAGQRWHPAPSGNEELTYVLDDGTGDVELHCSIENAVLTAAYAVRDRVLDRIDLPFGEGPASVAEPLRRWLERVSSRSDAACPSKAASVSRSRFIATFNGDQIDGLKRIASRDGVAVAEVVRRAVDEFLRQDEDHRAPDS